MTAPPVLDAEVPDDVTLLAMRPESRPDPIEVLNDDELDEVDFPRGPLDPVPEVGPARGRGRGRRSRGRGRGVTPG